jgi:hypothetical protein
VILPTQLVIPGLHDCPVVYATTSLVAVSTEPEVDLPAFGQGVLFVMPPEVPVDDGVRRASPTQRGAAGHAIFKGHVLAAGLNLQESPDPGHAGDDCWVETRWVQIKTTGRLASDGRLEFHAGRRGRFDRYTTIDFFAFVVINVPGLHGRVLIMDGVTVRSRWPGPKVSLRPSDFPYDANLHLLAPKVTTEVIDDLLAVRS